MDFGSILGGPGPSKNWEKKTKKKLFFCVVVLKEGSERVLGGFWDGSEGIFMRLGCILGRFGGNL